MGLCKFTVLMECNANIMPMSTLRTHHTIKKLVYKLNSSGNAIYELYLHRAVLLLQQITANHKRTAPLRLQKTRIN
jgi:hypothetical protein